MSKFQNFELRRRFIPEELRGNRLRKTKKFSRYSNSYIEGISEVLQPKFWNYRRKESF